MSPYGWDDAVSAAALMAIDPAGLGGVTLRSPPGPVRDAWLALLRAMLPATAPLRRVPANVTDDRLLGGLDLAATLKAGRPVAERGLLVEADGGVLVLAMAERLAPGTAARLTAVLDAAEVVVERDGIAARHPACVGMVALDEGIEDEHPPEALRDRLAVHLDLRAIRATAPASPPPAADAIAAARERLGAVAADDEVLGALCQAALALGIVSLRVPLLALRVCRASAALSGRDAIAQEDVELAARLVLAPRATQLPVEEPLDEPETGQDPAQGPAGGPDPADASDPPDAEPPDADEPQSAESLGDIVLAAAAAAIPPNLLATLKASAASRAPSRASGRARIVRRSKRRGRPIGSRRGELGAGARLSVIDTLLAAAPWQRLRRHERAARGSGTAKPTRVEVRREDFHIFRFKQRTQTTTIFVVDASGSAALNRLAEAKGAVEYLLADCYIRRDQVALISFRGQGADLLLPPTRSLARAKRSLAGLPGGGGTPLAAAIDAACGLAGALKRRGETPAVVLLTDARANIARDGSAGRAKAEEDAMASARLMRVDAISALLIDTSPRPQRFARQLAAAMDATYLALPHADAAGVAKVVRTSADARKRGAAAKPSGTG